MDYPKRQTKGLITKERIENNKELLYYLIGLIASDGYMDEKQKHIEISLKSLDAELLQKISLLIYDKDRTIISKNGCNERCRFFIYGKENINLFKKYGIKQNKSATLKLKYEKFEKDYIWHFIRGYFDGDGYYNTKSGKLKHNTVLHCTGTYHTMKFMQDFFKDFGIHSTLNRIKEVQKFDYYRLNIYTT